MKFKQRDRLLANRAQLDELLRILPQWDDQRQRTRQQIIKGGHGGVDLFREQRAVPTHAE